jgi:hypothetical protein
MSDPDGDPPRKPSWRDDLIEEVDNQKRLHEDRTRVGLFFPVSWLALMNRAAKQRQMSLGGYARRAIMAFVAHDLDLDWGKVMKDEPRSHGYGVRGNKNGAYLYGTGHGAWLIREIDPHV